ncbi:hypothetical protein ABC1056 [Shouchella clausii KSM-K16]|uniref:Uncharacterized protein n=1 Tax=Shouchella clausii (strain KSM-K16) TaxID=66692 RepID=Q5WJ60_SHOC1|nr:hypothetical protein [Shouchella clausii]BAD63595.1 hypothetical protein ABC1056 [Shouchella clausii KSM-K16]
MSVIKIFLEYQCYPMWIYNERGELVDNDLVGELEGEDEIDNMLLEIQNIYDNLFEDNTINFEYKGFSNENEKTLFLKKVENTVELIKEKLGDKYLVENKVEI